MTATSRRMSPLWRYRGLGAVAWQVHRSALTDPCEVAREIHQQRGIQVEDLELVEDKT